jgi:hypothetical protein
VFKTLRDDHCKNDESPPWLHGAALALHAQTQCDCDLLGLYLSECPCASARRCRRSSLCGNHDQDVGFYCRSLEVHRAFHVRGAKVVRRAYAVPALARCHWHARRVVEVPVVSVCYAHWAHALKHRVVGWHAPPLPIRHVCCPVGYDCRVDLQFQDDGWVGAVCVCVCWGGGGVSGPL